MKLLPIACAVCLTLMAVPSYVSAAIANVTFSVDPASPTIGGSIGPADVLAPGPGVAIPGSALGLDADFFGTVFDNVNALSYGRDSLAPPVFFSVDRVAVGLFGSAVNQQAQPGVEEAAGDVYRAMPPIGGNVLHVDEEELGLIPGFFGDDLDALELDTRPPLVYFSVDALSANGSFSQDILVSDQSGAFGIFAAGVRDIGLVLGDDIDALALEDRFEPGVLNPGIDRAWFSLTTFSASAGPADVLGTAFTGSFDVVYSAAEIGLRADDELNALDTVVPEPASYAVWGICAALIFGKGALRWRSRP
jgi:hypothetical protein